MNLTPEEEEKIKNNLLAGAEAGKNLAEALKNFGKGIKDMPLLSPAVADQLLRLDKNYENK